MTPQTEHAGGDHDSEAAAAARRMRVDGTVAVVTGGGGAIGGAAARLLAAAGSSVVLVDLDSATAASAVADITSSGGVGVPVTADVSDPEAAPRIVNEALERFGRLDILVNNAGISPLGPFLEIPIEQWRRVFAVNLEGPLMLIQRAAPVMMAQEPNPRTGCRGKIINVSSKAADVGRPFLASYGATKAALNHVTMTASLTLADHTIASTAFYPGGVQEGLLGQIAPDMAGLEGQTHETFLEQRAADTAMGRFSTPDEMAIAILFIAWTKGMRLNGRRVYGVPIDDALAR